MMTRFLPFLLILSFLFSCQPEYMPEMDIPADSCRIEMSHYYGGGGMHDSAFYTYEAGRLSKITSLDYEVRYRYNGNTVSSMEYYDLMSNSMYMIDSFDYTNGILTKLRRHDYDLYWQTDTVHTVMQFNYTNSKLTSILTTDAWQGFPDIDTAYWEFEYTGDNVTKLRWQDSYWAEDSILYTYDNTPNYFANVGKYFFQHDPFFQIHVGFEPHLPYFISKNNVTSFTIDQGTNYPIEYQLDSTGRRPILVSQGGFDYMGYKYHCP